MNDNPKMKIVYFVWLLSFALIPFFQGGYFYFEAYLFGTVQLFSLWFILQKQKKIHVFFGYRTFFYIIILCAAFVWPMAIDKGMHVLGVLKLLVVLFFILVYDNFETYFETSTIDVKGELFSIAILAGSIMSILVIGGILFLDAGNPVLGMLIQKQRIGGLIQYANTFGIYLFIVLVLTQYRVKETNLRSMITVILSVGIILTQSRGTLLLFGLYALVSFVSAIYNGNIRKQAIFDLSFIILGFVLGQMLLKYSLLNFDALRSLNPSLQASEWQTRLLYYEDGFRLFLMKPSGYGYLGYHYIQSMIQTQSAYHVKFIHSAVLQMGLDYGALAMISFLVLCLVLPLRVVSNYILWFKKTRMDICYDQFMLAIGIGAFFLHLSIDFDTEYIIILLLLMIGLKELETSLALQKSRNAYKKVRRNNILHIGLPLWIIIFCYMCAVSFFEYTSSYSTALKLYPYYTEAIEGLLLQKKTTDTISLEDKFILAEKMISRNPYNTKGVAFLAQYDYNNSKIEASLLRYEQLIKLAPLRLDYLEAYVDLSNRYCERLYTEGKLDDGNKYLRFLATLDTYLMQLKLSKENNYSIINQVNIELTPKMKEVIEKSSIRHLIQTIES